MNYLLLLKKYWKVGLAVFVFAGVWFGGYSFRARLADADIAELNAAHAATLDTLDRTNRDALQAATDNARAIEQRYTAQMAALDLKHTQELQNAQDRTEADIAAVRAGELRLRNRFTCDNTASPGGGVPPAGAGSGLGDATRGTGLQPADGEFLIRLAGRADAVVLQLRACQAIVAGDRKF